MTGPPYPFAMDHCAACSAAAAYGLSSACACACACLCCSYSRNPKNHGQEPAKRTSRNTCTTLPMHAQGGNYLEHTRSSQELHPSANRALPATCVSHALRNGNPQSRSLEKPLSLCLAPIAHPSPDRTGETWPTLFLQWSCTPCPAQRVSRKEGYCQTPARRTQVVPLVARSEHLQV